LHAGLGEILDIDGLEMVAAVSGVVGVSIPNIT
jgi:hypothetical protein